MFDLAVWRSPWGQRRRFLASRDVAPQALAPELARDLAHVAEGTCEAGDRPVVRGLLSSHRRLVTQVVAQAVAGRLALLAAVLASSRIFAEGHGLQEAFAISGTYLACQLAGAFFTSRSDVGRGQLAQATTLYLTARINRQLLRLDPEAAGAFTGGTLKNLVSSDVKYFSEFVSSLFWNLTPALASVLILGPVVFHLAGWPGLVGIAVSFGNVPLAVVLSRAMQRAQAGQQIWLDRIATRVGEWLRNVRLSRYLGWQEAFEAEIAADVRRYVGALTKRHLLACLTFGVSFAWWMLPVVAMLVTSRLAREPLDLTGFFSTLWVIKDLGDYLQHLPHTISLRASAKACRTRLDALEQAPVLSARLSRTASRLPAADAVPVAVELRNVSFAYAKSTPVLMNLQLRLDLSQRTVVVGEVGAGKTTLLRLLAGELAPTSGEAAVVFSDGTSAPLWDERIYERYRSRLGYAPQEPFISNATLAANVALAAGDAGPAHVEAAYLAELEADLALLPRGFAEPIGEAGVNLSGGQRQRVNLARAFYSRRRFLLLDDPLSAVDVRTEASLMQAMLGAADGFVLVSHRLAELARADRVLVLAGGSVVEDGVPSALLAAQGSRYGELARSVTDSAGGTP